MLSLKFDKSVVLDTLRKNREKHAGIVKEAQKGYREKAIAILEKKVKDLKENKTVDPNTFLQVPPNFITEYDDAIEMLSMSDEKLVVLDESTFSYYMKDRWNWRSTFLQSNSAYSGTARELSNQDPSTDEIVGS